ncbi:SDR family oxidoreductase [Taibaiella helva]|uniref:SDR family oxidoreductase n=1 Tax=Taibaiella helva TaxID=2301235 RepID=UPI000E581092|nr:SDR family oxidoreductase [Taibaiella helva]
MKIVVIGGTGLIGSQLVTLLKGSGHEVLAASPNTGVNTLTGEGLAQALQGAEVVVDVSNSPSFDDEPVMHFFKTSNGNLLPAEQAAGVRHHVALSVVGTQELQSSGYFRAKQVQEDMIRASGIPYTLVHATQFFEFAGGILHMSLVEDQVRLPDANIQPIASRDVAAFMARVTVAPPANKILEIGGPEKFPMAAWIGQYAKATGRAQEIVTDTKALYSGAAIEADTLAPKAAVYLGATKYADWIAQPENRR